MKRFLLFGTLLLTFVTSAQELVLKKGMVLDSIKINDSIPESFALYLPTNFDVSKSWPTVFVFDTEGRGRRVLNVFAPAAEEQGYILAASNNLRDSLSIADNMAITRRLLIAVSSLLPLSKDRNYSAGFSSGGRLASVVPIFFKNIKGTISCGAPFANKELLSAKKPFHFIGIVGDRDYNYPEMLALEKVLNRLRMQNQLLVFEGGHEWPKTKYLSKAMEYLKLAHIAKSNGVEKDSTVISLYNKHLGEVSGLMSSGDPLRADHRISQMFRVYQPHMNIDSLKETQKALRRSKDYRAHRRNLNATLFKEGLIKGDYDYYLEEDILTYNYNNLGWWNYQMQELEKYKEGSNTFRHRMADRLRGYINALIEDNIDLIAAEKEVDEEALNFLWMLKTITAPKQFKYYLNIISQNAKNNDYATALFYLEELLKQGYTDKDKLYSLDYTALLRITPEFNEIVEKYLKDARYEIIEE